MSKTFLLLNVTMANLHLIEKQKKQTKTLMTGEIFAKSDTNQKNKRLNQTSMKITSPLVMLGIALLFTTGFTGNLSAQDEQATAKVTTEKTQKYTPVVQQVFEMTDGDEILTEKVVAEMYKDRAFKIEMIMKDDEYKLQAADKRKYLIKESEVIGIINSLKN